MQLEPIWTYCLHLISNNCPYLKATSQNFYGIFSPRPELNQDLAIMRLTQNCETCILRPERTG